MEELSHRVRLALKLYGISLGEDDYYTSRMRLEGYLLEVGFNKDGEEILIVWMSEPGWPRSWIIYEEIDGVSRSHNGNRYWQDLVKVVQQLRPLMVLDDLADV